MANLKEENKLALAGLMGTPLLLTLVLQVGLEESKGFLDYAMAAGFSALATVVLVMLADVLPQSLKHKLVFLRLWHELPGYRCHQLCFSDARLDREELVDAWPHVFGNEVEKSDRNRLWYKHIYKDVMEKPQVRSAHKRFLLYRDSCAGTLVVLLTLILWTTTGLDVPHLGLLHPWAISIQGGFLMLLLLSAQSNGKRMVVNATVTKLSIDSE
ncbi:hypothetical protein K0504_12360 [Neiella marina]|uniref:SMODS and SLOG-associating 2TM effector domain-containing protein n=1 Tax=Neiella holothuriorum TaxID=2870530 RepID=A0ABS7EHM8_9GAMM|nr:hypothetical protein [Neiella holothuriorum]MBW8191830.1 hypothetical protein [Neiella holothuriorum]